jgi:tetratricopeptide (TPR) repeat protein
LATLAETKTVDEAEALFQQSFEKFEAVSRLKPSDPDAWLAWGSMYVRLARMKTGDAAEVCFCRASEKYGQALKRGGKCYLQACLYALRPDREKALVWLERSLKRREYSTDFVREDKDWEAFLIDPDFINLLHRFER